MTVGTLIPLLGCLGACAVAGAVIARAPTRRVARLAAGAFTVVASWTLLQLAWQQSADAETALVLMRLAGVSHLTGPLALHVFVEANPGWGPRLRGALRLTYTAAACVVALQALTPWFITGAVRTPWGWGYTLGPGMVVGYLCAAGSLVAAWLLVMGARRREAAVRPPAHRWRTAALIGVPLAVGSATDFALPMLGIQAPLVGSACLVGVAGAAWFGARNLGYSLLSPRTFAHEILETLPDGVALLRGDRRIHVANGRMAALLSLPRRDLIGCCVDEFLAEPLPDASEGGADQPNLLRLPTGEAIPVSAATRTLADRQGEPLGQVLVLRDQREVVSLRARLVTSARMAALGELAAGIAHEVNNPVAFIQTNLNLLGRHLTAVRAALSKARTRGGLPTQLAASEERVAASRDEVERIASVVREVQGFAHAGPEGFVAADVNELVESAARVATPLLRGRLELERAYGELPRVACAPQQLKQLFLHLIVTASRAPGAACLRVATAADGRRVHVVVECGPGAERAALDQLRDPFAEEAAASLGEGADLGLAICQQIVDSHGGTLRVEALHGIVHVALPLRAPDDAPEAVA